jgi:hypothetical protein
MQRHRQQVDLISLLLFFQNKESRVRKEMPTTVNQFVIQITHLTHSKSPLTFHMFNYLVHNIF